MLAGVVLLVDTLTWTQLLQHIAVDGKSHGNHGLNVVGIDGKSLWLHRHGLGIVGSTRFGSGVCHPQLAIVSAGNAQSDTLP